MRFEIEPKIGLGNFVLGMNINQVLTLIKRNGYYYKQCKIISNKEKNTPIFLEISSELITLRFNYYTQNLELIEKRIIIDNDINNKNSSEVNSDSEYYYKNKLFYMQNKNKEFHIIKYQNIAQLFGLSKVPKRLNKNKNIFLEYSGIGFYFTNVNDLEKSEDLDISADPSSVDTNSVLSKFFIFKEDSLYESLNTKNIFQTNDVLIKYNSQKGKSIKIERNNDNSQSIIRIGDNIEDVLRELKNPNYIYYANDINENFSQNQDSGDALYNQTSNKIFYLNYFKYGFDIMICNNKVNRIILHTNQIGDSKFGIYERCNFKLKLKKDYLATLLKTEDKFEENKEETNNNNLKEPKSQNEIKEKRKSSSRKSSENEDIKKKDKINIKEKEEIKKNDKLKEKQNHDNKKEENQKELNSNIKNINEKEEKNEIKEKEEIKNDKQIKQLNNQKEENIDMKKDKIENKEIEKEKERNIKEENINNENKKEEKEENEIQNLKNSSSQEKQKKENKEQEIEKEIENNENDLEKEEKEKKEEEISKEKEEKEKEEKEKEKEDVKVEEEKEKEEKNKEINKFEEKQQEETKEGEKKEEENKQSQKNNYTSNKNNRKRRKKHGNPPKKKNEIKSKEENEESEDDNDETKKKENENKGEKEDNKDNKDKEYISIFPWSDFKEEFLSKINYNKNLRHQKWDEGTSKIINCYFFNGLLFEVVDKNVIGTVIIY